MRDPRITMTQENYDNEDKRVSNLITIPGGKLPPGEDWLSPLPKGTVFLAKVRNAFMQNKGVPNMDLTEYHVYYKYTKSILLMINLNQDNEVFRPVDPKEFCKVYELHEITSEGTDE